MLKVCLRRAGLTALSAGFEQPLLSRTEENETRGLCRAASESHLWSFLTVRFSFSFPFPSQSISSHFQTKTSSVGIHSSCCYFHGAAAVLSAQLIAHRPPHPPRSRSFFKPTFRPPPPGCSGETRPAGGGKELGQEGGCL